MVSEASRSNVTGNASSDSDARASANPCSSYSREPTISLSCTRRRNGSSGTVAKLLPTITSRPPGRSCVRPWVVAATVPEHSITMS